MATKKVCLHKCLFGEISWNTDVFRKHLSSEYKAPVVGYESSLSNSELEYNDEVRVPFKPERKLIVWTFLPIGSNLMGGGLKYKAICHEDKGKDAIK